MGAFPGFLALCCWAVGAGFCVGFSLAPNFLFVYKNGFNMLLGLVGAGIARHAGA